MKGEKKRENAVFVEIDCWSQQLQTQQLPIHIFMVPVLL